MNTQIHSDETLSLIQQKIEQGKTEEALSEIEKIEALVDEKSSNKSLAQLARGIVDLASKKLESAKDHFESCLGTEYDLLARLNLCSLLMQTNQFEKVLDVVKVAIDAEPLHVKPRLVAAEACLKLNRPDEALKQARIAAAMANREALAHHFIATASNLLGDSNTFLHHAKQAALLKSSDPLLFSQYMAALCSTGDYFGALGAYKRWSNAKKELTAEILTAVGGAYHGTGSWAESREAFLLALQKSPGNRSARLGLLEVLAELKRDGEFDFYADQFMKQNDADFNLNASVGHRMLARGDVENAIVKFRKCLEGAVKNPTVDNRLIVPIPAARIRHDYEQLCLIKEMGDLRETSWSSLDILKEYHEELISTGKKFVEGSDEPRFKELVKALTSYHHVPQVDFTGPLFGFSNSRQLEKQYEESNPKLLVIDNFLSPEALAALRKFCVEANVWKRVYNNGYVGSFLSTGFVSPIVLRIADGLRVKLNNILSDHPLKQAWGFKYDQKMTGINIHADFAAVNVNFWIAPEDANLNKENGGMVIYDVPSPKTWSFHDYNADSEKIYAYLEANGAKAIRVPYKENRCVMFDSSLFHATDEIHFAPGYENRRINVTLLYGQGLRTR
jgi:tetratricopeptide (TPR) repeat protein